MSRISRTNASVKVGGLVLIVSEKYQSISVTGKVV
jgi:hypothetical protein